MPTEIVLRKRASTRVGEIGLFCDVEVWEDEFRAIKNDSDVKAVVSQPRSLKQHKFAWALATKVAEACDWLETKDDAMEYMLIEAKHRRLIYDPIRQISYARALPTNWGAMDGVAFTKLLKRMTHIVGTHIVPGIDKLALKAEIERMLNPDLIPTDDRPEPPPIDTIPDGPGVGHNRRPGSELPAPAERDREWVKNAADRAERSQTGVSDQPGEVSDLSDRPEPGDPGAPDAVQPAAAAATDDRAAEPDPSQRAPEARETASEPGPANGTVWTVDMPGDPNWAIDTPGDAGMYHAYARFHIERAAGAWAAREWLNHEDQWQLRQRLGVQIGIRKQLERHCDEHHEGKR